MAIQEDFAAGVKEIDQENAAEEDEDNFDPDEEHRDYEDVARALPVFCVSSRAYQKMCGRLPKDGAVLGFLTRKETEIPQLRLHCKKLTKDGRIQTARAFLLALYQLLATFNLWASNDGTSQGVTDDNPRTYITYVESKLKELEAGLAEAKDKCLVTMRAEIQAQIINKYPELINNAIEAAPNTAKTWGLKNLGGLIWSSYKAVVRREGVHQFLSAGPRDFNADL